MKTSSAKAKGRRLQQWVRSLLIETLHVHEEDIESRSMGSGGEDLIMARDARCKNQEKINVWESYNQAKENCKGYEPIVVMKRNKSDPLVVIDAKTFINLHKRSDNGKDESI